MQCGACGYEFDGRPPRGHVLAFCPKCEAQRATPPAPDGKELDIAIEYMIAAADMLGWEFAVHRVERDGEDYTNGFVVGMGDYVQKVLVATEEGGRG